MPATTVLPTPANACGQRLIPLINQVRAENGLLPLVENPFLSAAAQRYAEFIASRSILSHTADGRTLDARAQAAGYTGWKALGENLAARRLRRVMAFSACTDPAGPMRKQGPGGRSKEPHRTSAG